MLCLLQVKLSLSGSSQPVTNALEMKYESDASTAYATEIEPKGDSLKRLITDDDVAAVMISKSAISEERPTGEEGTHTCWDKNTLHGSETVGL